MDCRSRQQVLVGSSGRRRTTMKVAIVGGGIGGMALALSLHDAGIADVDIYESAPAIKELGVGINVLPHAVRELTELGLLDDLRSEEHTSELQSRQYLVCRLLLEKK